MYANELCHYGIKGQKWGVRRYQYADGSLTPAGQKRYNQDNSNADKFQRLMNTKVKYAVNHARTIATGRQYVDGYLKQGITLSRIQTSKEFENFAFYATYKKQDSEKYMGLFGKNLRSRAAREATKAEKISNASGSETDIARAKELRERSDNMKVYQVKLEAMQKLKIPSDENASHITANLLKEKQFKDDVIASIQDSKEKMRRPQQQILFNQAQKALTKEPARMTASEKVAVYKALNLSLTNHNSYEISAQNRFYSELKKKGYNALLDYNDKDYSSYHAKRPMIVFDVDSVKLHSVTETNPKVVDKFYRKYNAERIAKEVTASSIGIVTKYGKKTVSECSSFVNRKMDDYMNTPSSKTKTKTDAQIIREYKKEHPNTNLSSSEIVSAYKRS